MTEEQRKTLEERRSDFKLARRWHYDAAVRCEQQNFRSGLPVVVISAVVGTSVFSSLSTDPADWVKIVVGCASLVVSVLAGFQTFLMCSERAEKHRIAGARFAALHKEIDQILASPPNSDEELSQFTAALRTHWEELSKESPTVSRPVWQRLLRR